MLNSYYSLFVCYDYIWRLSHDTLLASDVWCRMNIIINIVKCIIAFIMVQFILSSDQWYVCRKCVFSIMRYSAVFLHLTTVTLLSDFSDCHYNQSQRDRRGICERKIKLFYLTPLFAESPDRKVSSLFHGPRARLNKIIIPSTCHP